MVDTGGLANDADDAGMASLVAEQANVAIAESDWVVFLVNAREGLTAADEEIADDLRRCGARTLLVANKIDGVPPETALADFSRLGFGAPLMISAAHGRGIAAFRESLAECADRDAGHGVGDTHAVGDSHVVDTHVVDTHAARGRGVVDTHPGGAAVVDTHAGDVGDSHRQRSGLGDTHPVVDTHPGGHPSRH